jgi:P2 family phage contractile tail tube protein
MAMPKVIKHFNLFVDGRGYAGRVDEVTEPKLSIKKEEFRGGGMDAPVDIDMGMEKIELQFTLVEHDPAIYRQFGLVDGNAVRVSLRQALADDAGVTPKVITAQGMMTEIDGGGSKSGDKGSLKVSIACRYYKLQVAGQTVVEIDVENMKRIINGTDQLAAHRAALGM